MNWKSVISEGYPSAEGWYLCYVILDLHDHGHQFQIRWWSTKLNTWFYNGQRNITHWCELEVPGD